MVHAYVGHCSVRWRGSPDPCDARAQAPSALADHEPAAWAGSHRNPGAYSRGSGCDPPVVGRLDAVPIPNAAQGLATGNGVTIALLSTGADPTVPGLAWKATNGPDYISKPQIAQAGMLGTLTAVFFTGAPGIVAGAAPDARILAVRTEPDDTEPGGPVLLRRPEHCPAH